MNMDNNFDDIFDDNLEDITPELPTIEETQHESDDFFSDFSEPETITNPVVDKLLESKGLVDKKVTILNENNEEEEVDFYTLSHEEQAAVLKSLEDTGQIIENFEGSELIHYLEENNMTLEQFLDNYKQAVLSEVSSNEIESYEIDAYDDEELYMLDLKNKFDLTDEELIKELEKELQDSDLFKRKADKLREEYKQLEDQYKETQRHEFERQQQEQYDTFAQQMVDVAIKTPEFYGIELEDDEKNEVLSFLLDLDDNGTSDFYKSLNNPNKLYEAAWFLKYGKEAFDVLRNAYESEINRLKKEDKPKPVIRKSDTDVKSIHNLF